MNRHLYPNESGGSIVAFSDIPARRLRDLFTRTQHHVISIPDGEHGFKDIRNPIQFIDLASDDTNTPQFRLGSSQEWRYQIRRTVTFEMYSEVCDDGHTAKRRASDAFAEDVKGYHTTTVTGAATENEANSQPRRPTMWYAGDASKNGEEKAEAKECKKGSSAWTRLHIPKFLLPLDAPPAPARIYDAPLRSRGAAWK